MLHLSIVPFKPPHYPTDLQLEFKRLHIIMFAPNRRPYWRSTTYHSVIHQDVVIHLIQGMASSKTPCSQFRKTSIKWVPSCRSNLLNFLHKKCLYLASLLEESEQAEPIHFAYKANIWTVPFFSFCSIDPQLLIETDWKESYVAKLGRIGKCTTFLS